MSPVLDLILLSEHVTKPKQKFGIHSISYWLNVCMHYEFVENLMLSLNISTNFLCLW